MEKQFIPNSIQIKPTIIDLLKKTEATQLTWKVLSIERDENAPAICLVEFFNSENTPIAETKIEIPSEILSLWDNNKVIDSFVLKEIGLEILKTDSQPELE